MLLLQDRILTEFQRGGQYEIGFRLSIMSKGLNLTMLTGNAKYKKYMNLLVNV